jgi:hypothetical protein
MTKDEITGDGKDIFVIRDGVKIARRGHPGTPDAGKWVSLDPHWTVKDSRDGKEIELEYHAVPLA